MDLFFSSVLQVLYPSAVFISDLVFTSSLSLIWVCVFYFYLFKILLFYFLNFFLSSFFFIVVQLWLSPFPSHHSHPPLGVCFLKVSSMSLFNMLLKSFTQDITQIIWRDPIYPPSSFPIGCNLCNYNTISKIGN